MIYTKSTAFIHFQKTGGMSMTRHLVNILDEPVTIIADTPSHATALKNMPLTEDRRAKLTCVEGPRHAKPGEALEIFDQHGWTRPRQGFVVIRPPVDLMLSYYKHLRKPRIWEHRGMTADSLTGHVRIAMENNFAQFCLEVPFYGETDAELAGFFDPEGFEQFDVVPMHRVQEHLAARFGHNRNFAGVEMPHQNRSSNERSVDSIPANIQQRIIDAHPRLMQIYEEACAAQWQEPWAPKGRPVDDAPQEDTPPKRDAEPS